MAVSRVSRIAEIARLGSACTIYLVLNNLQLLSAKYVVVDPVSNLGGQAEKRRMRLIVVRARLGSASTNE